MPHLVIHCFDGVLNIKKAEDIIQLVHDSAESTDLFDKGDIKVRIQSFTHYNIGNSQDNFIHVFGNIMEGRTDVQKMMLSHKIVSAIKNSLNEVPIISMNIREFEKATYCNRGMV